METHIAGRRGMGGRNIMSGLPGRELLPGPGQALEGRAEERPSGVWR